MSRLPHIQPVLILAKPRTHHQSTSTTIISTAMPRLPPRVLSISSPLTSSNFRSRLPTSAVAIFHSMAHRDSISWNVVAHRLLNGGAEPSVAALVLAIKACWKMERADWGRGLHGLMVRGGYLAGMEIMNSLMCMYVRVGRVGCAQKMFEEMPVRDAVSWSVMVSGYARSGDWARALVLFREIVGRVDGGCIDGLIVVGALRACSISEDVNVGRAVHGIVVRRGFEDDVFVGNSLVDLYGKFSDFVSACKAFEQMPHRNAVSWNSMLSCSVQNGRCEEALKIYNSMVNEGCSSDAVTLVNLLRISKNLGRGTWCRCIHAVIIRSFLELNVLVANTLLDAYGRCGLVDLFEKVFEMMPERNLVSWSTMIAGYAHCVMPHEALKIFGEMLLLNERPNLVLLLSVIEACSILSEVNQAKAIHCMAFRNGLTSEVEIGTALLDLYAKCGEVDSSKRMFRCMSEKNVVSWSAMIRAYAMNGRAREALEAFGEMAENNVQPNEVTMLGVLTACCHGGLVQEGLSLFKSMLLDTSLRLTQEHFSCVMDMLARSGDIKGAVELIKQMPEWAEVGASVWGALLSGCRTHGDYEVGLDAARHTMELEPFNSAVYLLASNLLAYGGDRSNGMMQMRMRMLKMGVKVVGGYSLVYVKKKAHRFLVSDGSHPQAMEVYCVVDSLHGCMRLESGDPSSYEMHNLMINMDFPSDNM